MTRTQIQNRLPLVTSLTFRNHCYILDLLRHDRRGHCDYQCAMPSKLFWKYSNMKCKRIRNEQKLVIWKSIRTHKLNENIVLSHLQFQIWRISRIAFWFSYKKLPFAWALIPTHSPNTSLPLVYAMCSILFCKYPTWIVKALKINKIIH